MLYLGRMDIFRKRISANPNSNLKTLALKHKNHFGKTKWDLVHLPEWTFDRKRISDNFNPNLNLYSNPKL